MSDEVRQAREELMRLGLLGDVRTDGVVPDLVVRSWRRSISSRADGANGSPRSTPIRSCAAPPTLCSTAGSHI